MWDLRYIRIHRKICYLLAQFVHVVLEMCGAVGKKQGLEGQGLENIKHRAPNVYSLSACRP